MLGILEVFAAVVWGWGLAGRSGREWEPAERLATAGLLAIALLLWLPWPLAWALGIRVGSCATLGVVIALALFESRALPAGLSALRRVRDRRGLVVVAFAAFIGWLLWTHYFRPSPEGITSAGVTWGDLTLHASLANAFLFGDNFHPPEYPAFAGWPLAYPFLPDLAAAHLASLGLGLRGAMILLNLLTLTVLAVLLFRLARSWAGEGPAPWIALALFFLSGGIGFAYQVRGLAQGASLRQVLSVNATFAHELGFDYGNVIGSAFIASWGASFGMAIAAAVLLVLTRAFERHADRLELAAAGVLTGLLPLVHPHSFLTVLGVAIVYAAMRRTTLVWFFVPAIVLALPQLAWISRHTAGSRFAFWVAGWPIPATSIGQWLWGWFKNWGLFFVLAPVAIARAPSRLRRLLVPFILLFAVANLLVLSPNAFHNVKFFVYVHFAFSVAIGAWLARLWTTRRVWLRAAVPVAIVLCCLSGAAALAYELLDHSLFLSSEDLALGQRVREATAPHAVFLSSSDLHDPISVLTGRRTLLGQRRWLENHGIPFQAREQDVRAIYAGGERAAELLDHYQVDYVMVGPRERAEFPGLNEAFFKAWGPSFLEGPGWALYRAPRQPGRISAE